MSIEPHYLRFARALALVLGAAGSTACGGGQGEDPDAAFDANVAVDASSDDANTIDTLAACFGGCRCGPLCDTGPTGPLCLSSACCAGQEPGAGICGPLPPPDLAA